MFWGKVWLAGDMPLIVTSKTDWCVSVEYGDEFLLLGYLDREAIARTLSRRSDTAPSTSS